MDQRCLTRERPRGQAGFTVIEAVIVLIIVATVVGALMPSVRQILTRARVNRAANVMAADLLAAQSLASRRHSPVLVVVDASTMFVAITNPATGDTLVRRSYGSASDFKLQGFSTSVPSLLVFPNGMSSTGIVVTINGASLTRYIAMSRAGQVRIT